MATFLVTGTAGGIGSALCAQLAARGDDVIATCRRPSAELQALPVRVEAGLDLTHQADIDELVRRLGSTMLDGVIHNAGVLSHEQLDDFDAAASVRVRAQFEVNALAPLLLTVALLPRLANGARLALITSRMGSIGDNGSGGYYGYRMSKAALNAAGKSLAHDLRSRGVAVAILHPGFVRTPMTRGRGDVEPAVAATRLLARIDALTLDTSGTFWHADGSVLPW